MTAWYRDDRIYHMAAFFSLDGKGNVSPLCADKPRALDLSRHQLWTLVPEQVTCPKCRKRLEEKAKVVSGGIDE